MKRLNRDDLFYKVVTMVIVVASCPKLFAQKKVSLEECQRLAFENSYAIKQANEEYQGAKAKSGEMLLNFFPKVYAHAGSFRVEDNIQALDYDNLFGRFAHLVPDFIRNKTIIDISHLKGVGAIAVQPVFMGGKVVIANSMAREAVTVRENQIKIAQRSAVEEVEQAYWLVVELESKEKLAAAYSNMLAEAKHNVELLLAQGIATQSDLLSIKVKCSEAELKHAQAQEGVALAQMLLAVKCGLPSTEKLSPQEDLNKAFEKAPEVLLFLEDNNKQAVDNLPEMAALSSAEKIAKMRTNLERSAYVPHVALVAGVGYSSPHFWYKSDRHNWGRNSFVGVTVSFGITDAVSAIFKAQQNKAQWNKQHWETEEKRQLLQLKIEQAWIKYREADKQIAFTDAQQLQTKESLRLAELAYNEGLIPLLEFNQAQTLWLQVETSHIEAQIAKCKAVYELYRLITPGWYTAFAQ